tara:strand:+ start:2428 stop:2982 length:555 start_codon:yes stop_codon:yes gene_type:complete
MDREVAEFIPAFMKKKIGWDIWRKIQLYMTSPTAPMVKSLQMEIWLLNPGDYPHFERNLFAHVREAECKSIVHKTKYKSPFFGQFRELPLFRISFENKTLNDRLRAFVIIKLHRHGTHTKYYGDLKRNKSEYHRAKQNPVILGRHHKKKWLLEMAQNNGCVARPSWNKSRIVQAIYQNIYRKST